LDELIQAILHAVESLDELIQVFLRVVTRRRDGRPGVGGAHSSVVRQQRRRRIQLT
jgi:hypothetical protein